MQGQLLTEELLESKEIPHISHQWAGVYDTNHKFMYKDKRKEANPLFTTEIHSPDCIAMQKLKKQQEQEQQLMQDDCMDVDDCMGMEF